MIKPTIHMNGTAAADLMAQAVDVLDILRMARTAIARAAPNARDYYPQGPHAIVCALAEHRARQGRIDLMIAEYEAVAIHIDTNRGQR